jgi:hypothetical protein
MFWQEWFERDWIRKRKYLDIAKKGEKRVQYMEHREGRIKIMLGIALQRCD